MDALLVCRWGEVWRRRLTVVAASASLLAMNGCIDAQALNKAHTAESQAAKFAEIDLGEFQIELPEMPGNAQGGVVNFHAFGEVERDRKKEASKSLRNRNPRLRAEMLVRIRSLSDAKLAEPELRSLRAEIAELVNTTLEGKDAHVRSVGFYRFSFTPR